MPIPQVARTRIGSVWPSVKRTFVAFGEDDGIVLAASVAFYSALSMGPLLLLFLWITGMIGADAQRALAEQVRELLGPEAGDAIGSVMRTTRSESRGTGTLAGIVAIGTLVFSATGVFANLQTALNRIWEIRPEQGVKGLWDWLRKRLISLGIIAAVGFLLVLSLAVSAVVSFLAEKLLPGAPFLWRTVTYGGSVVLFGLLFAGMFRYLPDTRVRWRDVIVGAAVTAVLFALGKLAIGLYLGNSAVGSTYGTAGSLVVLLMWVYLSSILFFLGAEWTHVWATRERT